MKYKNNKRPIFGVIAAQAADMEQHQILNGIIRILTLILLYSQISIILMSLIPLYTVKMRFTI